MKGWQRVLLIIIPYLIIVGIFQLIGSEIAGIDLSNFEYEKSSTQRLIVSAFDLMGTFLVLWLFIKYVDKESFIKLGFETKNRLKEFNTGIISGLVIMALGYFILSVSNQIFFVKLNFDFRELLISILLFIIVAVVEEALFRGYILKNLMKSFNKYVALVVSSILFSLAHGFNPNIDLFSLFDLFLAGITLGIFYVYTKNLWFPIAFHLSWNLFQALFGFNVSGLETYSIIEFEIKQENLMNGGAFGFEGSYLSIIAELMVIIGIVIYFNKKRTVAAL